MDKKYTVALAGNPNVGKSTIFNSLTGMHQHTGNWPGKTVANATGEATINHQQFLFVDIPGTYSIMSNSEEEEIARDYICFGNPDATIVVVDSTCLERNLNLVFQIMEMTSNVILCVNLLDEAKKKKIKIDLDKLSELLGIPVVGTIAKNKKTLERLKKVVFQVCAGELKPEPKKVNYTDIIEQAIFTVEENLEEVQEEKYRGKRNREISGGKIEAIGNIEDVKDKDNFYQNDFLRWVSIKLIDGEEGILKSIKIHTKLNIDNIEVENAVEKAREKLRKEGIFQENFKDKVVSDILSRAETVCKEVCTFENENYSSHDRKIDKILTSKKWGIPIMILFLGIIFWLTIVGANYPSNLLFQFFDWIQGGLIKLAEWVHLPEWISNMLIYGVYQTLTWVISVMLPPMAIFFPLFTFLEDLGYLPRIAFNMDKFFKKACCTGKQMITMCMGFGCNACGVTGCRIIDSPRERLIAILTNNLVPCNRKISIFNINCNNICSRSIWRIFIYFGNINSNRCYHIWNYLNIIYIKNIIKNNTKRNTIIIYFRIATIQKTTSWKNTCTFHF